jgi:hypothetical protein
LWCKIVVAQFIGLDPQDVVHKSSLKIQINTYILGHTLGRANGRNIRSKELKVQFVNESKFYKDCKEKKAMKNRIFAFLLIVALAGFMVGLDYNQAHARAEAGIGAAWANPGAHAWTNCNGGTPCAMHDAGATPPNRNAFCLSNNANGTSVESEANTATITEGWKLDVRVHALVKPDDWAWGKGSPKFLVDAFARDTIQVEVDTTVPEKLIRTVTGRIILYPSRWGESWLNFTLKAGNSDQTVMCFDNYGSFNASGLYIIGTPPISWTTYISNDTLYATIADVDTIDCAIPPSQLSIFLQKKERITNVPTTTQWGIILLVGLIVASGVFIMLRRRKAAVPA